MVGGDTVASKKDAHRRAIDQEAEGIKEEAGKLLNFYGGTGDLSWSGSTSFGAVFGFPRRPSECTVTSVNSGLCNRSLYDRVDTIPVCGGDPPMGRVRAEITGEEHMPGQPGGGVLFWNSWPEGKGGGICGCRTWRCYG